jgi:hypothetical protein
VDALEAGYAGGGIVEVKLRVLKGLRGSEWSKGEDGQEKEAGSEAQRVSSEEKVSACNVAQCIYYAI